MSPAEAHASFSPETVSASQARRFVTDTLESWGRDGLAATASLLVTELAANAVLHAGTTFEVVVREGAERVRVEVHDSNGVLPAPRRYSNTAATGRGLLLVDSMSAEWGAEPTTDGKRVWFELDSSATAEDAFPAFDFDDFDLDDLGPPPAKEERHGPGSGGGVPPRASASTALVNAGHGVRP